MFIWSYLLRIIEGDKDYIINYDKLTYFSDW